MKQILLPLLFFVNIFLAVYIYYDTTRFHHDSSPSRQPPEVSGVYQVFDYQIPSRLSFANEVVPLDNPIVYEKLDNAFASTVYRHARTSLNYKRAYRWFPMIEKVLKKNKIPEDFKYIAVIESNLMNLISGRGATGFWQFMPATAKEYGLEVNREVDERYHPVRATEAAVKYFRDAYRKFNNWAFVAASYNMGMHGLKKRIEQQKVDSYYALYLNAETGAYMYYALATKCIFENPQKYGYKIPDSTRYSPISFVEKEVTTSIPDLIQFAKDEGIDYHTLKEYNPWLRGVSLTIKNNGKTYTLLIPEKKELYTVK